MSSNTNISPTINSKNIDNNINKYNNTVDIINSRLEYAKKMDNNDAFMVIDKLINKMEKIIGSDTNINNSNLYLKLWIHS